MHEAVPLMEMLNNSSTSYVMISPPELLNRWMVQPFV